MFNIILRNFENEYSRTVEFIRNYSHISSCFFDDESLDFVYIDANHDYSFIKKDLRLWYPKVKKDGWLGGHDFKAIQTGVVRAVNEFVAKQKKELQGTDNDWWIKK